MQTFDIPLSPESSSELPWEPIVERVMSGVEMFQPGDHLVRFLPGENIFHHGIVVSRDRSNTDVVHFDEEGVHHEIFGRFFHPNWNEPDGLHYECHRINYAHYDQTAREKVVARAEAFAEPPGLGSHPLATEPEDYLAYCLAGTWNVPRKEVSVVPLELPPLPPPRSQKNLGPCTVM